MATSTTTAVELLQLPVQTSRFHNSTSNEESQNASSDDILEASRLADSAVPEGGYGWVAVGACAVISWWVSTIICIIIAVWIFMRPE